MKLSITCQLAPSTLTWCHLPVLSFCWEESPPAHPAPAKLPKHSTPSMFALRVKEYNPCHFRRSVPKDRKIHSHRSGTESVTRTSSPFAGGTVATVPVATVIQRISVLSSSFSGGLNDL